MTVIQGDSGVGRVVLIVGMQGTGKTTIAKQLTEYSKKLLVIESDEWSEAWHKLPVVHRSEPETWDAFPAVEGRERAIIDVVKPQPFFGKIFQEFYGGTVVLEDARTYLDATTKGNFRRLVIRCRVKHLNLIGIFHSWSEIPPVLLSYCKVLCLFPTTGSIKTRARDIAEIERWEEITHRVNESGNMEIHMF